MKISWFPLLFLAAFAVQTFAGDKVSSPFSGNEVSFPSTLFANAASSWQRAEISPPICIRCEIDRFPESEHQSTSGSR
jgi:hypothetical protein